MQSAFEHSFPLTRLSRARAKDKVCITTALCRSSKKKSKLYKKWLQTKDHRDETKYKEYKRIFRKVALEAEQVYYKEKVHTRTNSVKKLGRNLNTVCSLQKSNYKTNNISLLIVNGSILTDKINVANGINNYFSTIGEKLDQELRRKNNNLNPIDFKKYCDVPTKNSIFVTPTDSTELMNIIIKLSKFLISWF